uniref:Link (Hyaluronan-binding) domain containing protein n=1 Tax=Nucleocytoviricota sp. TaxID=2809609 RepID=A0A9E8G4J1_9VIRU|nr:link (hyaluronan-binding) domain containing protein [Nucleocytoviricota sp.]UZT29251.1 link (hyaluronan-binding) domain containing protein [Nucleocytoviricota sp.]
MDNTNNNFNLDEVKLNSLTNMPGNSVNFLNNLAINPIVLIILVIVIIFYFVLFSSLGGQNQDGEKSGNGFLEALLWGLFILLLLLNGASYFLNTNIFATIKNLFSNEPQLNISLQDNNIGGGGSVNPNAPESEQVFENPIQKEVYHIPGNEYTYEQAKAVCKAFDGDLANYEQIEDAYDKGANWCSYGWSADQLALFPTNMKIWKKLQKEGSNPNACGRPGINGGYIANQNVRFGANCFGNKPLITSQEKHLMETSSLVPKTQQEINFNNQVDFFRNKLKEILVAPFNRNSWNEGLL